VLSRVAESLYWIGRYVERAEDTSRLLDVHVQTLLEDPWVDERTACHDLLRVMGVAAPEGELDSARTLDLLAFDRSDTSSIVGALAGARENARGVREALSSELWECLNATYHSLPAQQAAAGRHGPHGFFRHVRERAAVVSGLLEGTMPRDDGWRFLVLGRSLERVDMTARLLWARAGQHNVSAGWVGLLKSCSAHEAYLRTYRSAVEAERVVEFLVLDRLFPRSVYAALAQAERCLADLDPSAGRTGLVDDARRYLGRARTDLEYRTSDELLDDLPELLDMLQRTVFQAGDALSGRYFHRGAAVSWTADAEA
jgi:uncharacterized alpha-E superfamily protein